MPMNRAKPLQSLSNCIPATGPVSGGHRRAATLRTYYLEAGESIRPYWEGIFHLAAGDSHMNS